MFIGTFPASYERAKPHDARKDRERPCLLTKLGHRTLICCSLTSSGCLLSAHYPQAQTNDVLTRLLTMILLSPLVGRLGVLAVAGFAAFVGLAGAVFLETPPATAGAGFLPERRRSAPRRAPAISSRLWSSLDAIVMYVEI